MAKIKRKTIPKKVREQVFNKYGGRCAYCGVDLDPKNWQLDHIVPVQRECFGKYSENEIECFDNYVAACRTCNHYKRAHSLETFRRYIEEIPDKLTRDSYIYRIGLKYDLIAPRQKKIVFYFEQCEKQ